MSKTRRVAAMMTAALAAVGLATTVAVTPAAAAVKGPHLITNWTRPVAPDEGTWVDLYWKTGKPVCDAEVTIDGKNVSITYPSNTETYTSFSKSANLKAGKVDRTAFYVIAYYDATTVVKLKATIVYNTCGDDAVEKTKKFDVKLPVMADTAL
ncbi:hypothetical protein [Winogradskya humida]|uniref:Uncharacterized protein n=1 Tax=Winogradskya humida TaxID=113566 RepID=A0ABQ4A373_9ACTN|nr:hypothetical protein [Actinoplanes humidus]GIE25305.1 hypothetical protein Ahu01nite_084070 [Actinoplanes humidus]